MPEAEGITKVTNLSQSQILLSGTEISVRQMSNVSRGSTVRRKERCVSILIGSKKFFLPLCLLSEKVRRLAAPNRPALHSMLDPRKVGTPGPFCAEPAAGPVGTGRRCSKKSSESDWKEPGPSKEARQCTDLPWTASGCGYTAVDPKAARTAGGRTRPVHSRAAAAPSVSKATGARGPPPSTTASRERRAGPAPWWPQRGTVRSRVRAPVVSLPGSHRLNSRSCTETPSVQFSSVAQSCPTLCNPMGCSTPGFPVHHQLLEFTQAHVH